MIDFCVVRFVVYDEPIWRFGDQGALQAELSDPIQVSQIGDSHISWCPDGLQIDLAVEPFEDFSAAFSTHGPRWHQQAIAALREHFLRTSPQAALRLYRDPVDGVLRNLVD